MMSGVEDLIGFSKWFPRFGDFDPTAKELVYVWTSYFTFFATEIHKVKYRKARPMTTYRHLRVSLNKR